MPTSLSQFRSAHTTLLHGVANHPENFLSETAVDANVRECLQDISGLGTYHEDTFQTVRATVYEALQLLANEEANFGGNTITDPELYGNVVKLREFLASRPQMEADVAEFDAALNHRTPGMVVNPAWLAKVADELPLISQEYRVLVPTEEEKARMALVDNARVFLRHRLITYDAIAAIADRLGQDPKEVNGWLEAKRPVPMSESEEDIILEEAAKLGFEPLTPELIKALDALREDFIYFRQAAPSAVKYQQIGGFYEVARRAGCPLDDSRAFISENKLPNNRYAATALLLAASEVEIDVANSLLRPLLAPDQRFLYLRRFLKGVFKQTPATSYVVKDAAGVPAEALQAWLYSGDDSGLNDSDRSSLRIEAEKLGYQA